jgi:Plasmid pRiA4b ORF-3-like protein
MRPPGRLARRGTVDIAQDWGRSSTFAPYLLLTLVSQVHPVSLAIPTPRRCLTCAATVLRVTSRDHDPAELHRRFEEIITGMDLDDLKELAGQLLTFPSRVPAKSETRPSLRKPGRGEAAILRVRVDLAHAKPPIWRRLDVCSDIGLDVFHQVLQSAFGWMDSHLHRFALGGSPFDRNSELFLCPYDVDEGEDDGTPAKDVTLDQTLSEPGDVLHYCYDYGDSWDLIITLESVIPLSESAPVAVCIDGRRAAPPEDCGGLREAAELAEILEDPTHFDLDEINQALNDPYMQLRASGFDPRLVELLNMLRYTPIGDDLVLSLISLAESRTEIPPEEKATALRPILWLLDYMGGDGLLLTSAGHLKPDDVTALASVIPAMADWIGTANRESHTYPVLSFRESVQKLGLVRKYRGKLLLTKQGANLRGNPNGLWRYIAGRLPVGKHGSIDVPAGLLALVFAASTRADYPPLGPIAEALNELGWRHSDRSSVSTDDVHRATADTVRVLENLAMDPRPLRGIERHQFSAVAAALARDAVLNRGPLTDR